MGNGWKWSNVPIPEVHLVLMVAGVILNAFWPLGIGWDGRLATGIGAALIAVSVALVVWATVAAGRVKLADPDRLITTGPYGMSRHPMYVAWTILYLGMLLILASGWLLMFLPVLAIWVNWESSREEKRLVEAFGPAYAEYRRRVRRYL